MVRTARRRKEDKLQPLSATPWEELVGGEDLAEPKKHKAAGGGAKDEVQDESKGALGVSVKGSSLQRSTVREGRAAEGVHRVLRRSKMKRKQKQQHTKMLKMCFCCRQFGHTMSNCPQVGEIKCFRCGEQDHTTQQCTEQSDKAFPFATCFICNETGHIARMCPDNPRGIYPKGGGCRTCGSVEHKKADCPKAREQKQGDSTGALPTVNSGVSADAEAISPPTMKPKRTKQAKKVITF